jgi:hypothetical protein
MKSSICGIPIYLCTLRHHFCSQHCSIMSNQTYPFHAPWGYEYLATQLEVNATWTYQLMQTLVLWVLLRPWWQILNYIINAFVVQGSVHLGVRTDFTGGSFHGELIQQSMIVSFFEDCDFIFSRRFTYITFVYITNRWVPGFWDCREALFGKLCNIC